ncbi:MAG TPA: YceI family protein [Actinomycetes bacterium]|nr:YceI family protein [Actinomycetes bacterium]
MTTYPEETTMSTATTGTAVQTATGTWEIDPSHTRLGFAAKHAMVTTVRGQFDAFSGTLVLDAANPAASTATVEIDAASFSSGSSDRDAHVRSAEFLDVETFPTLTFVATDVRQLDDQQFVMAGDLTIRGTSRPVKITAELEGVSTDPFGSERIGFSGTTTISRKDFGLTWNVALEAGGVLVSDKVKITLDVSAVRQG